jgi:predicted nucleic acid-binding protein
VKLFVDTNVLVAACIEEHEHHGRAIPLVESIHHGEAEGCVSAHSLLEVYAVLTRLPRSPRLLPAQAATLIKENILEHFSVVALTAQEYGALVRAVAADQATGGQVYDRLHLECARKSGAERIYTFNTRHFAALAPAFADRLVAP